MTHILIAHDGSEEARRATEVGMDLALRYAARVTLLTVIQHPAYAATVGEVQEADAGTRRCQRDGPGGGPRTVHGLGGETIAEAT